MKRVPSGAPGRYTWISRILIAPVVLFNLQCSMVFLLRPDLYFRSFNLSEPASLYMIQGLGLLFLMWNVPYLFALWHPRKHIFSLWESVIMQAIGFIGESLLLLAVPEALQALRSSVIRFMLFDGIGFIFLISALLLVRRLRWPSKHSFQ